VSVRPEEAAVAARPITADRTLAATPSASATGVPVVGAVAALWWREMVRFARQRSRLFGAFAQPLLFWALLGGGFAGSFRPPGTPPDVGALQYFYPGIVALTVLFTAIFATIAVVEDRQSGFLQGVLVAPVSRTSVVLGQALGATSLALLQAVLMLALAPIAGVPLSLRAVLASAGVLALIAFALTNVGLVIAWRLRSTQGFHVFMNVILMPMWLLSGAFFPTAGVHGWLGWLMWANPLTYGMAALRRSLYLDAPAAVGQVAPLTPSLAITVVFCVSAFVAAVLVARRND
jgi:ABC-2 type transport system permease protein